MKRDLVWLVAVAAALGIGYGAGRAREPDHNRRADSERGAPARDAPEADARNAEPPAEEKATDPAEAAREAWEEKTGRPPTDAEWKRITEEAAEYRRRLEATAEKAELLSAHQLAAKWVEEQRRLADAERGGMLALLEGLRKDPSHVPSLVADRAAFAKHFSRKVDGPRLNGTALAPGEPIPDGAQIEFPAGVHALDTGAHFGPRRPFPKDLLVAGVGMDQTLVRLTDEIRADSDVVSLTFRDLTLHCNDNYLIQFRGAHAATIRLERCRVIGFDMGAGGSNMVAGSAAAFFATDCRFEAGYARTNAGFGNLFDLRGGGLLVRMENCAFVGPFASIFDRDNRETYHFEDCEIRDTQRHLASWQAHRGDGIAFRNCTFIPIDGESRGIRRNLADINPDWER